ncbi:MAG: PadR family transcriptional regulator [Acidimicrobiales bacterium]|nr:PadR family transcriptional regulator [Acidimicrobiales bacterium]MCB9395138.1 PadR family transcriptional regulator [Acidimicrobiaceae bacterium]
MRHGHREKGMGREYGHGGHGGPPRGRGGRMRRGDTRYALLSALTDGPGHGYELIQRLEERTGGRWKPSPGSVYPTLQLLEETGLVRGEQRDDKRIYSITEAGQTELANRVQEPGGAPWMAGADAGPRGELRQAVMGLMMASKQIGMQGDTALVERAAAIVADARKQLYQLLADA